MSLRSLKPSSNNHNNNNNNHGSGPLKRRFGRQQNHQYHQYQPPQEQEPQQDLPNKTASGTTRRSIIMQNKQRLRYKKMQEKDASPLRKTRSDVSSSTTRQRDPPVVRAARSEEVRHEKRLDRYGFIINMDSNGHVYQDTISEEDPPPTFAQTQLTERREKKWSNMMQSWDITQRRRRKLLCKRLRKGIPESLRGTVWPLMANVPKQIKQNRGKYDEFVRTSVVTDPTDSTEGLTSSSRLKPPSPLSHSKSFRVTQDTIERDIHRTYPRHSLFHEENDTDEEETILNSLNDEEVSSIIAELEGREKQASPVKKAKVSLESATGGQASLRRVLKAYSVYDREVGYCQGMNFIAGMFLTFMSEEDSFWLLVFVMKEPPLKMRGLFLEGMQGTHQVLYVAEKLTLQFLPRLSKHMEKENIHITMYATQWLLTLYTSSFQFDLVTRVWDVFLGEGWKIVFRVMLALLQDAQPTLMNLGFEEILAFFRELPDNTDGTHIMDLAMKIPLRKKHIEKYEKEWMDRRQQ